MYKQLSFDFRMPVKVAGIKPQSDDIKAYKSHRLQLLAQEAGLLSRERKSSMKGILIGINTSWSFLMLQGLEESKMNAVEEQLADALQRFDDEHRFRPKIKEIAIQFKMHALLSEMEHALAEEDTGKFLEIYQSLNKSAAGKPSAKKEAAAGLLKDASLSSIAEEVAKLQKA